MPPHVDASLSAQDSNLSPIQSADFLHTVITTAAEGICVCAEIPDFPYVHFTVWNDRMTELTGYTMAEINTRGWYQSVYPDPAVRQRAIERMERMRSGDNLRHEEWTITRKGGADRVVAISTSLVSFGGNRAVVALMTDVTERTIAVGRLRESESRLAMAQGIARVGSWEWDIRTGAVWWSAELYRLYGQDPATFQPSFEAFMTSLYPDDAGMVRAHLERTLQDGSPYEYEARIVQPDGSVRWKRAVGKLERDAHGIPIRLWGTAQDVTDQKLAAQTRQVLEEQLREARRLESIGVLAAGVAHDFNNLLTTIVGHVDILEMESTPGSPVREHLVPVRAAAAQAAQLCKQMLAFAGKGRLSVADVDLSDIVAQVSRETTSQLHMTLVNASIRGDAEQLKQLLRNLIANAMEARAKSVGVGISSRQLDRDAIERMHLTPGLRPGAFVVLEVADDGVGMSKTVLEHAFEPFYTTKFRGRGLGLPVVLGVVRVHGGGIEVESAPGRGTAVRVYLPA